MNPDTPISLAIPTYNRFDMVLKCVEKVIDDPRIGEVVICDDASTDGSFDKLCDWAKLSPKIKLFRNEKNLDCYANKAQVLRHATLEWAVMFDSDNQFGRDYLDRLYEIPVWDSKTSYLPVFARPYFDYRKFEGDRITRENVSWRMNDATFRCALNTANYFVHRETYLGVWDSNVDPHTADSLFMNYRLLAAGNSLVFVPGLEYDHLVHEESHYKKNCHLTGNFVDRVEKMLRDLR